MNTSGAAFDSFNVAAERQIGRYGDKPLLTWYDDHRDERVELSYRTFGNWVAKTANLLVDEYGAEPGDRVGVLADHWQVPKRDSRLKNGGGGAERVVSAAARCV